MHEDYLHVHRKGSADCLVHGSTSKFSYQAYVLLLLKSCLEFLLIHVFPDLQLNLKLSFSQRLPELSLASPGEDVGPSSPVHMNKPPD